MKKIIVLLAFILVSITVNAQVSKSSDKLKVTKYYESGKIKSEGNVVNNKKEGAWVYYHENGAVALKKNFVDGVENGEWLYYSQEGKLVLKVDDISKVNNSNLLMTKDGSSFSNKNGAKQEVIINQKF